MGFTFCSVVYESARPFITQFVQGIVQAAKQEPEVDALIVVDGLANPEKFFLPLEDMMPVTLIEAPGRLNPAGVRRILLEHAMKFGSEFLVFSDCDDILEPEAFHLHGQVLESCDFSYGDQLLMDAEGRLSGGTLYTDWSVPERTRGIGDLTNGNFVGFSGAAIKKSALNKEICDLPIGVLATDWWVFSRLLMQGAKGGQTRAPVVRYRQYGGNLHGALPSFDRDAVLSRCNIALAHFGNLPSTSEVVRRLGAIKSLMVVLDDYFDDLIEAIKDASNHAAYWYEDVVSLALQMKQQY